MRGVVVSVAAAAAADAATVAALLKLGCSLAAVATEWDEELLVSVRMAFIHFVFIPVLGRLNFLPLVTAPTPSLPDTISARDP